MEDFLQKIWHAKTWFIATLILTYCLSGISSSLSEIRKTAKNQLDHSILLDDTGPEQKLQLKIIDLYKESHTDLGPILLYYKSLENKEHINKEEQNTGRNYAAKTVEKLRINYASSAGIRLACSECRSRVAIWLPPSTNPRGIASARSTCVRVGATPAARPRYSRW